MTPARRAAVLAVGDVAMLVLFAVLGRITHDEGLTVSGVGRTAGPLLLGWAVVASLARTYARPNAWTLVRTWFPAVTIGVLVRYAWLRTPREPGDLAVFWLVTLAVTLALLIGWRLLATRLLPRATPR